MRVLLAVLLLPLLLGTSVFVEGKGDYPEGKDPLGLEKSRVFRILDLSREVPRFICSGFLIEREGAYYGVTAGHCTRGYFAVRIYHWLQLVHLNFRAASEGPGRDIALFSSGVLPSFAESYKIGRVSVGDKVFVDGFSGKGRRATNCTVEYASEEAYRYYKTLRCSMPLYFGMSGSPVLKEGKVVGLVTHLFVDDFSHVIMTSLPEAFDLFGR